MPPGARNSDTRLAVRDPSGVNLAYASSKWDTKLRQPRIFESCGVNIRTTSYQDEMTDTYVAKFSVIRGANSLRAIARKFTKRVLKTQNMRLEQGFARYLATNVARNAVANLIRSVDDVFSQASRAVDLIEADVRDELAALFAAARTRAAELTSANAAIRSAETGKPGVMGHTLKVRAGVVEALHAAAIDDMGSKSSEFKNRAKDWYYQKLDEQYNLTLKKEKAERERIEKSILVVNGGFRK